MKTLIIYDKTGKLWNVTVNQYEVPEGLTAEVVDVPDGSQIQRIDMSGEEREIIFATLPDSDMRAMKAEINTLRTENAFMNTALTFAAETFTDEQALKVPTLYDLWMEGVKYLVGKRVRYNDGLYKVITEHKSQADWTPDVSPTLFVKIEETHEGTLEDPIPASVNLEYEKGKYYIEDGVIYLMNRSGMTDGETIVLQYVPSQLVGQYFEVV